MKKIHDKEIAAPDRVPGVEMTEPMAWPKKPMDRQLFKILGKILGNPDVVVHDGDGNRLRIPPRLADYIRNIKLKRTLHSMVYPSPRKEWWIAEDESGRRRIDMRHVFFSRYSIDERISDLKDEIKRPEEYYDKGGMHPGIYIYYRHIDLEFTIEERDELDHIIDAYASRVVKKPEATREVYEAVVARYRMRR